MVDLAVLAGGAGKLVAHGASAETGREPAHGVFATRSPFRPNPVGLSVVALKEVVLHGKDAPYLIVTGADLMDGTPIYDIKPYLPHIDSHPEARGGFAVQAAAHRLHVVFPEAWLSQVPAHLREPLTELLAQDPRPSYQHDPERVYGFPLPAWRSGSLCRRKR